MPWSLGGSVSPGILLHLYLRLMPRDPAVVRPTAPQHFLEFPLAPQAPHQPRIGKSKKPESRLAVAGGLGERRNGERTDPEILSGLLKISSCGCIY